MRWRNLVKVAFRSIMKNRMRSMLTMLGMIIGVGSVIALISVGSGTQSDIEAEIESLGTNLLIIRPGSSLFAGVSRGAASLNTLSLRDVEKLQKEALLIEYVSPVIRANGQVIAGRNNWFTSIEGVLPNYVHVRRLEIGSGSFFTERDVRSRAKVAVLGKTVDDKLFPDQDPVGARIRIRNVPFTVIGVLQEKGENPMGADQDDVVLTPSTTALYRLSDGETVNSIVASATSGEAIDQAATEVTRLLREEHRLTTGEEDDFSVRSQTEITERATSITGTLTLLLGSIAGVSLVVGGIGIMNIMLVSVTERTKEIGIRLAVGARESDVLVQFLVEAVIISLIGGVMGIVVGIGAGAVIARLIWSSILIDPVTICMSFFFSGAIGVFFGFYPARKAAALDPILALHYE